MGAQHVIYLESPRHKYSFLLNRGVVDGVHVCHEETVFIKSWDVLLARMDCFYYDLMLLLTGQSELELLLVQII